MSAFPASPTKGGLCFRLSCWTLGLIAFAQLLIGGVALALRMEAAREVKVEEKIVTRIVEVDPGEPEEPAEPKKSAAPVVALPPVPNLPEPREMPEPRPLEAPPIADPDVERLVEEAREARVAEDMGTAIVKLKEARAKAPDEPSVHYELGLVYEEMAAFDADLVEKATDAYQAVYELGTSGAGALFELAANKLSEGIALPREMRGKLSFGRVRIFKDQEHAEGQRVILTIPVRAAPGKEPAADDFFVQVRFFNKNARGEPVPAGPECRTSTEWVSGAFDWLGGEETLRVNYTIPPRDPSSAHLFGNLEYYGQVVEMFYKNELIDTQAWPRHLAGHQEEAPGMNQGLDPLFEDEMPSDFGPGVLPPLEDEVPADGVLPLPGE